MLARVDGSSPSQLAVPMSSRGALCNNGTVLDPRTLVHPQAIGPVTVQNSKEVTIGTKVINVTVDNTEKVTGQLLGLEFVSETNRSRTIRCSCAVAACFVLLVAVGILVFILCVSLKGQLRRIDLGLNESWYLRRDDWQAVDPKAIDFLVTPLALALIGHTSTPYCNERTDCIRKVRAIQKEHTFSRRFDDIGFNYLVAGGGLVFEGRGANVEAAFLSKWNRKIISIGFLGDYRRGKDEPDDAQIEHVEILLARLVELDVLVSDYRLMGKCQITGDVSPGALLNLRLKDFSHWHSGNFSKCPPD